LATDSMMSRSVTTAQWHTYIGKLSKSGGCGVPAGGPPGVVVQVSLS
jgi:hypothetical protein